MKHAIFMGERNVKDLVARLFQLPDKTAKTAKQVAEALVHANPQLKDPAKIAAGTIIKIPGDAPPLKPGEEASATLRGVVIASEAQHSLEVLNQRLQQIDEQVTERTTAFLASAKSAQVPAFAKESPDFRNMIASIKDAAQAVAAEMKARDKLVADLLDKLTTFSTT